MGWYKNQPLNIKSMWKTLKELNVEHLKFKNHTTTKTLDDIIHNTEDIIYYWYNRYISPAAQTRILNQLKTLGEQLTKEEATPRQKECLERLRNTYSIIQNYQPDDYTNNKELIEKMMKYSLANYLKKKPVSFDDKLQTLKNNKILYTCIIEPYLKSNTDLQTKFFVKMQDELLADINKTLRI